MKPSLRKNFFIICLFLFTLGAKAQDIIVTNKAERIEAKIIEVSENEIRYKKTRNPDGPIFVLSTNTIDSIYYANGDTQTYSYHNGSDNTIEILPETSDHTYKGLEFSTNAGVILFGKNTNTSVSYGYSGIGIGKRLNKIIYVGVQAGFVHNLTFPTHLAIDSRFYIPVIRNFEFYTDFNVGCMGYLRNLNNNTLNNNKMYFAMQSTLGFQIAINPCIDLRVGGGTTLITIDGTAAWNTTFNAGISYHSSTIKNENEIFDNGLQFSAEIEGWPEMIATSVLSYKIIPELSLGIGFSSGNIAYYIPDNFSTGGLRPRYYISYSYDVKVNNPESNYSGNNKEDGGYFYLTNDLDRSIFIRSNYRILNKRFSPFISLDLGCKIIDTTYMVNHPSIGVSNDGQIRNGVIKLPNKTFFITPAIGLSYRFGLNSYLEAKVSYQYSNPIKIEDQDYYYFYDPALSYKYGYNHVHYKNIKYSTHCFYVSIGYTRTLDIFRRNK